MGSAPETQEADMRTTIHFAGINNAILSRATEGYPVLISYADIMRRPGVWTREILPRLEARTWSSVILDSGAFTVISAGIEIDADEYGAFVAEYGHLFDVVVNLDDIAGDLEATRRNQTTLERYAPAGTDILPVFHQGEPWEVLEEYVQRHDYIGVGFARKPGGKFATSIAERRAFLREFFARVGGRAKVHGFGMTAHAREGYPFASVDSTTWIAETCAMQRRGAQAERIGGLFGKTATAFDRLERLHYFRFVCASYAFAGVDRWCSDAKGQAGTPFMRFGHEAAVQAYYYELGQQEAAAHAA